MNERGVSPLLALASICVVLFLLVYPEALFAMIGIVFSLVFTGGMVFAIGVLFVFSCYCVYQILRML
jgi:hypothetical protein